MWTFKFVAASLLGLLAGSLLAAAPATAANTLTIRVTARDFMSALCLTSTEYRKYWFGSQRAYPAMKNTDATHCPIYNSLADGTHSAHPDFEADGDQYAQGCDGYRESMNKDATIPRFTRLGDGVTPSTNDATQHLTRIIENHLEEYEDGIPKPVFARSQPTSVPASRWNTNVGIRSGWVEQDGEWQATNTGKTMFDLWYRDDKRYSKRVSSEVVLTEISPGLYASPDLANGFHPLDPHPDCLATADHRIDCSNGGKIFPRSTNMGGIDETNPDKGTFAFTTELHLYFTYTGSGTFSFTGDDDVWVFINNKLAVVVGGLHSSLTSAIDLSHPGVRSGLGLVVNQTYALDMYHAERHTEASNFKITTNLVKSCNVQDSGGVAYAWNSATLARDWKIVGGPTWGKVVGGDRIQLLAQGATGTTGYAYLRQQQNVGTGFIASFKFRANGGSGFVFAIQRDTITNLDGGTSGHLGFKKTANSVGIALDFCTDRAAGRSTTCGDAETRMHFVNVTGGINSALNSTKQRRAMLIHPNNVNDNKVHEVEVRYYAGNPPWLDVFLDGDLFLTHRDFDLNRLIGGRSAWLGFTGATGTTANQTGDVFITDFTVKTVAIVDEATTTVGWPTRPVNVTANGRDRASFTIRNYDVCNFPVEFGGFARRARGLLTPVAHSSRRMLQPEDALNVTTAAPTSAPVPIEAVIVDTENGHYNVTFATRNNLGEYTLEVWFGESCFVNGTQEMGLRLPRPDDCFYYAPSGPMVKFLPVELPPPTPEDNSPAVLPPAALAGIGVAAGIVSAVGAVMIIVGVRIRNRWRRDKEFIEAGRLAAAERGVEYLGDNELDELQNRLQRTLVDLQKERAKKAVPEDKQALIDELNRQRGELQEQVRILKVRAQGGDPALTASETGFMSRARKSFAGRRTSRAMSRGWALSTHAPAGDREGRSSDNPLFQRDSRGDSMAGPARSTGYLGRMSRAFRPAVAKTEEEHEGA